MNAQELRIGNYAKYADCNVWMKRLIGKPKRMNLDDISELHYNHELYEPIELTEDILLKCAFVKAVNEERWATFDMKINTETNSSFNHIRIYLGHEGADVRLTLDYIYYPHLKTIKHLHQLQNLFYSITQSELQVNL